MTIAIPQATLPVYYTGTTITVITAEVINPTGTVIPPEQALTGQPPMVINLQPFQVTNGSAGDPLTVTLMVRCEGQKKVEYDYPAAPIVRIDTGLYSAQLQTLPGGRPGFGAGLWTVEWAGTGAISAIAARQFLVIDPPVIPSWL